MTENLKPRIENIDLDWAIALRDDVTRRRTLPVAPSQIDYYLYADQSFDVAALEYALGAPLERVRMLIAAAAEANLHVFELRATVPGIDVTVGAERHSAELDLSLTNSRRGLFAVYEAETAGESGLAARIAGLIYDPPHAPYLGEASVVCSLADQRIAYAVKALYRGQPGLARQELAQIPPPLGLQAQAVEAIVDAKYDEFTRLLFDLLVALRVEARREESRHNPEYFIRVPAIALSRMAIARGLVRVEDLPSGDPAFPLEFFAA